MRAENYTALEKRLDYTFTDKSLLTTALTHSSYANEAGLNYEENNERLEFIGDAYLDAFIGRKLFEMLPTVHEGSLSKHRAEIVCERSLAEIAREIGLGEFLFLGKGEDASGGRKKDSVLSDAMEAVIGAMVFDGGGAEAERVVLDLFHEEIILAVQGRLFQDYKSELQEKLQEKYKDISIEYVIEAEHGPDHNKMFETSVRLNGQELGRGKGHSKKEAEQEAARSALSVHSKE